MVEQLDSNGREKLANEFIDVCNGLIDTTKDGKWKSGDISTPQGRYNLLIQRPTRGLPLEDSDIVVRMSGIDANEVIDHAYGISRKGAPLKRTFGLASPDDLNHLLQLIKSVPQKP